MTSKRSKGGKLFAVQAAVVVLLLGQAKESQAFAFHDALAFAQRAAHYLYQFRVMMNAAQDHLAAFRHAYEGMKDWSHLGWQDVLGIADMPWFDGIDGIDDIRTATALAELDITEAQKLWHSAEDIEGLRGSRRYQTDRWYRAKVESVFRQSKKARATRMALVRQMNRENQQLTADVKLIDQLHDEIRRANQESPVNQGKVSSLQAELAAVEAKYQGQHMQLVNQRAVLFLVGEEAAQQAYSDELHDVLIYNSGESIRKFGEGFAR